MGSPNVEYQVQTFQKLRELQTKGLLCDLVLISVDRVQFRVHASVVVAASQSFYNLLMEKGSLKKIRLMNVTGNALGLLVRFIYGENLNDFDELKLLSQTLMKLGMKDLFQFVGTSLCDFTLTRNTPGSPTSETDGFSSRKKSTAFSNEKENPSNVTIHSDESIKSRRDGQKTKSLPCEVKVEPFSEISKNNKCENDTHEDFSCVKIKSEPPDTFNYIYGDTTVDEFDQHAEGEGNKRSMTDRNALQAPVNSALKPVGLYMNETLTQNKSHSSRNSLSDIENLAEKCGIVKPPSESGCSNQACDHTNHSYKAVIGGLQKKDHQDSKTTKEFEKPGNNADTSPKQHKQVSGTMCTQHGEKSLVSGEGLVSHVNIVTKRVPVFLRPIDESGHYALFPANHSMAAFENSPVKASRPQQYAQNPQLSEAVKLDTSAPQKVRDDKQVKSDQEQPETNSPDKSALNAALKSLIQSKQNSQPPLQTGQQIIIPRSGQLASVLPQRNVSDMKSNLTKPAPPVSLGLMTWKARRKQKIKPTFIRSSKVRKIVPKEELKIEDVVSLQGNPETHSKKVKDFLSNLGIECPADTVTDCSEVCFEDDDKLGDDVNKDTNEVNTDSMDLQRKSSEAAKRKSGNEKCPPLLKKMKDVRDDLDEEDSQEYLVIDLEEDADLQNQDSQMSGGSDLFDPQQEERDSVDSESHPSADKTNDKFHGNQMHKVQDLSIQEVPNFIVGRKKKAKTLSFTLCKELNFFHDQEEVPPSTQFKIPRSNISESLTIAHTTRSVSASSMSASSSMTQPSQVSCVRNASQNVQANIQNTIKPNSGNGGAIIPAKNVPVMVQLPDGKLATVMIQETVQNNSQMPAVRPQGQVIVSQGQVHTNSNRNTQSQMVPVPNTCRNFVQGLVPPAIPVVSGITQPITNVMSGTQQLIHQPLSNGNTVSNVVQGIQPISNILQPPIINGTQVVGPQFLVRNIADQNFNQAQTIPGPNSVQLPGQQMIVRQTQPVPLPNMPNVPLNCFVNGPTPFSQTLQVPAGVTNTTGHPGLQIIGANGSLVSQVPVGHQVPSQLIMSPSGKHTPTTINQMSLPTILPKTDKMIAAEKHTVPKKSTGVLKELRPKFI